MIVVTLLSTCGDIIEFFLNLSDMSIWMLILGVNGKPLVVLT